MFGRIASVLGDDAGRDSLLSSGHVGASTPPHQQGKDSKLFPATGVERREEASAQGEDEQGMSSRVKENNPSGEGNTSAALEKKDTSQSGRGADSFSTRRGLPRERKISLWRHASGTIVHQQQEAVQEVSSDGNEMMPNADGGSKAAGPRGASWISARSRKVADVASGLTHRSKEEQTDDKRAPKSATWRVISIALSPSMRAMSADPKNRGYDQL